MAQYKLTAKGIQEGRKKRTVLKGVGEAVSLGGPWKGQDYANLVLISMVGKDPHKARDVHQITAATFEKPARPGPVRMARTLGHLTRKGYVQIIPTGRSVRTGASGKSGQVLRRTSSRSQKKRR